MLERLKRVAAAAIAAVDGERATAAAMMEPGMTAVVAGADRVFGVSVGKAAPAMHRGLQRAVPSLADAIVVAHEPGITVDGGTYLAGGHPAPTEHSATAGLAVGDFLRTQRLTPEDLVIFCISGGTSALIAVGVEGLDVEDLQAVNDALLRSGAGIEDVNAVRRMVSATHNGGLAAAAAPAQCVGLLVNDVPGAPLDVIGSGPTFPARDTSARAAALIAEHVAEPVRSRALAAVAAQAARLPRDLDVENREVAGPTVALAAAQRAAERLGLRCELITEPVTLSVAEFADRLAATVQRWLRAGARNVCLAAAGEVAVQVTGSGTGGRCQHLAWEMIKRLDGIEGTVFLGQASDGRDHVEGVGGAWADGRSMARLSEQGTSWDEVAADNDSCGGLTALGQLLPGRTTGTNVADVYLLGLG